MSKILRSWLRIIPLAAVVFAVFSPAMALMGWDDSFLRSKTECRVGFTAGDEDSYSEAGYGGPSRSKLYEKGLSLAKTTVISPYNPTGECGAPPNVVLKLRGGFFPIRHTFNVRFPTVKDVTVLASHLPRDLMSHIVGLNIAPEDVTVTWVTLNQPFTDDLPFLVRPHHAFCPDHDLQGYYLKSNVSIGIYHPDPDHTRMGINKDPSWGLTLDGRAPHTLNQFEMVIHDSVASPSNMQIGGLTGKRGDDTHSFWISVIKEKKAIVTLHTMASDADQAFLSALSKNSQEIRDLPAILVANGFAGPAGNVHLKAINTLFLGRDLYDFDITIPRTTGPFSLPDGSKVAISGDNSIWVKQPTQGHYATSWHQYAIAKNLNYKFVPGNVKGNDDSCLYMHIPRGKTTRPFLLSDGSEVAINDNNNIWVKQPTQGYYATPWKQYAATKQLQSMFIIHDGGHLPIPRGTSFYPIPGSDNDVIAVSGDGSFWVGKEKSGRYVTRWAEYAAAKGLMITPILR